MKFGRLLLTAAIAAGTALALPSCSHKSADSNGNKLVILHTNDTHSQILPDANDKGGVLRRMAVIDSIRNAESNVMLVDAGDVVQGTLFFYLYGGKVEQELMNIMGVEARILGNHEFDNGIDSLAAVLKYSDSPKITTNYNVENTPLKDQFVPYLVKEYGDKKIGLFGINLDPVGMIASGNYNGLEFMPIVATANLAAEKLRKEENVDAVIALTHIGYNPKGLVGDSILATNSRGIDIIIGGHSHDVIDPATPEGARRSRLANLDGEEVLVVQTGKAGRKLGKIEIDLDSLGLGAQPRYELIDIDNRYDSYRNPELEAIIDKYSAGVDSLMHLWVGETERALDDRDPELLNYFTDFIYTRASSMAPGVDLSIANKGGLRSPLPEGKFSKGHIINMLPFANYINIIDVKGSDLADVFDVMAMTDGNGVSKNVKVKYSKSDDTAKATEILIDGKPLDPNKTYRVATIDYLAKGGDYMTGLTHGSQVARSSVVLYDDLLDYIAAETAAGHKVSASPENRWTLTK